MKTKGSLHRLIDAFQDTFQRLGIRASPAEIESLAVTVHRGMTVHTRHYHSLDHVFSFYDADNPFGRLAALYHDIVYYQVDEGFVPETRAILGPYIQELHGSVFIARDVSPRDLAFRFALAIFGFQPGQRLSPDAGQNEFLSALMMNKALERFVPPAELLKMTAYVEATIPFRWGDEHGADHFEVLEERLRRAGAQYGLSMSPEEIGDAVRLAVWFSNRDVDGFAEEDTRAFVDGTWKLLPETNPALRAHRGTYSIREYRMALQKTEAFLSALDIRTVFHRHRGMPSEEEYAHKLERASINVRAACDYLRVKLVTLAIVEALAEVTGGNAALALFMGDLSDTDREFRQLVDFLPEPPARTEVDPQSMVLYLLDSGRPSNLDFDSRQSPLSVFVYKSLGPAGTNRAWELALEMFAGELAADAFLRIVDRPVVSAIARASAEMVSTRRDKLLAYAGPVEAPARPRV